MLIGSEFFETSPAISPDGRWLAYTSLETAERQVYVRPFPEVNSGKWPVSAGMGSQPTWSSDGTDGAGTMMSVSVEATDERFNTGKPGRKKR